jgi:sRNA-binding regulator protein Hfq
MKSVRKTTGIIKGVLREELENSLRMKRDYERELEKLPRGSLIKKKIKGHEYYYLVLRENGKVRFIYKPSVSKHEIEKYTRAKEYRGKYRKLLSQVKRQIRFLRSTLRGKVPV